MRATLIVGGGLGLALVMALVMALGCSRPEEPQFQTLDNVEFAGADLESGMILLTADAVFHNPNAIGLDVTELDLTVLLDGRQAATIKQAATASVAANADFTLPIKADIPLKVVTDALRDEGGSLLGGLLAGKELEVRVDGWVRVKLAGIQLKAPVHHQDQVAVKL